LSSTESTAARFNAIAAVYDETREPLSRGALDKIESTLNRDGCRKLLEAGVGTGRIAIPLSQRGFDIVGIDVSPGMLAWAKKKGLGRLIMADGNLPPFRRKAFDAVVMAHVLHLLEDPAKTFKALEEIASREVVVLTRARDGAHRNPDDSRAVIYEAIRRAATELGYVTPPVGGWQRNFMREVEFLARLPPNELLTIQDVSGVTTLEERLKHMEKRAYGWSYSFPEEAFHKVIERAKSSLDPSMEVKFRRVERMAIWKVG
jgi:SAM-dependent methyltransferase